MQAPPRRYLPYRSLHFHAISESRALTRFRLDAVNETSAVRLALALGMSGCGREATRLLRKLGTGVLDDPVWEGRAARWAESEAWWKTSGAAFTEAVRRGAYEKALELLGERGDSFWDNPEALSSLAALAGACAEPYLARHIRRRVRHLQGKQPTRIAGSPGAALRALRAAGGRNASRQMSGPRTDGRLSLRAPRVPTRHN